MGYGYSYGYAGAHPPAVAPWSPGDLGTKLLADWDADKPASLDLAGSIVTAWTDQKSGYAVSQSVSGSKPAFNAAGLAGRGAIVGDAIDDRLVLVPVPPALVGVALEIWMLVNQPALVADATARGLFYLGGTNAPSRIGIFRSVDGGANRVHLVVGNGTTSVDATVAADFSGVCVIRAEIGLSSCRISLNGVAGSSVAVATAITNSRLAMLAQNTTGGSSFSAFSVNAARITAPLTADEAANHLANLNSRGGLS